MKKEYTWGHENNSKLVRRVTGGYEHREARRVLRVVELREVQRLPVEHATQPPRTRAGPGARAAAA